MKKFALALIAGCLIDGSAAQAQSATFSIGPYAGAFVDNIGGTKISGGEPVETKSSDLTALMFGVRAGARFDERMIAVVDVGFSKVRDVGHSGTEQSYVAYGRDHLLTTLGLEYALLAGRTAAGLEFTIGADWTRENTERTFGLPPREFFPSGDFGPRWAAVPGAWVDVGVGGSLSIRLAARDYILVEPGTHNFAIIGGIRWGLR